MTKSVPRSSGKISRSKRRAPGNSPALSCTLRYRPPGVPSLEAYEKVHYVRAEADVWERALDELDREART